MFWYRSITCRGAKHLFSFRWNVVSLFFFLSSCIICKFASFFRRYAGKLTAVGYGCRVIGIEVYDLNIS